MREETLKKKRKYLETDTGTADVGYPEFDAIDGFVAQETIKGGEGIKAKQGEAGLEELDELENGGNKGGALLCLGGLFWGAKRKMLERGWNIVQVVGGHEAILGGVAWVLEGEGAAATAAHAEEVDVGIEVVADEGKVARGDVDDGVVGAKVGERGEHERAMRGQPWLCAVRAEEGEGGVPGSDGIVGRIGDIGVEGDGVVGYSGEDDEERVGLALDNPLFDRIQLVLADGPGRRRGQKVMWTGRVRWEQEHRRHVT